MSSDNWRRELEDDEAVLPPPSQEWQDAHGWRDGEPPPGAMAANGATRQMTKPHQRCGYATASTPPRRSRWEPSSRGCCTLAACRCSSGRQNPARVFGH